jgi:hypothetical protein
MGNPIETTTGWAEPPKSTNGALHVVSEADFTGATADLAEIYGAWTAPQKLDNIGTLFRTSDSVPPGNLYLWNGVDLDLIESGGVPLVQLAGSSAGGTIPAQIVDSNGVAFEITGTASTQSMTAAKKASAPTGAAQIFDSPTGIEWFRATINPYVALTTGQSIVIAYSTTSLDTGVEANAEAVAGAVATATGVPWVNAIVLNANNLSEAIRYDGTNTIKRIAAVATDTTSNYAYILQMVA